MGLVDYNDFVSHFAENEKVITRTSIAKEKVKTWLFYK